MKRLGAVPVEGGVAFAVWAPTADSVDVRTGGRHWPLERATEGVFSATLPVAPGEDYVYVLDGEHVLPDPCSRCQPAGLRGPSRILDPQGFEWAAPRPELELERLVVYELHVGAFSAAGTFADVETRLVELKELGITAIEVMPIATFPGERNWGYDGVYAYAPHPVYGGPFGFQHLVDAAHRAGLGVILDVVYNHIGPGSEAISAFGPYFTDRHSTFWGPALDFRERGVREWAIQNAEMWVRDYQVDGLRLDAVHSIYDDSPRHVLTELADRVHAIDPRALVISEIETGDFRPIEEWSHDAQWADEFHHVLHVLLTGEREGYYESYRPSVADLADQLRRRPADRLVICSQNHDQVGNRAVGDRPKPDELRLRAAALLFAPQVPLLFMGEEYGEQRPFQFFTDHIDPAIADATRQGRRREFERFAAFAGEEVPDPQAVETFLASKLDPDEGDTAMRDLYGQLLALRAELPRELTVTADDATGLLRLRRGHVELVLNFSDVPVDGVEARGCRLFPSG